MVLPVTAKPGPPKRLPGIPRPRLARARSELLALGGLLALLLLYFGPLFHPDPSLRRYLADGDVVAQFYPFRAFAAREWWQGRAPLWNPDILAGHPFLADPQTAVFYPPSLLTAVLLGRAGLPYPAMHVEVALHYLLAGLFTYLLVRRLTGAPAAALLGATVYTFGGYLTSYPMQQLPMLEVAVWLPLILYLIEVGASSRAPWRGWLGAGLAFGLALLAGHSQTCLFVAYLSAAYLLWRGRAAGRSWPQLALGLALFGAAGAGLAAVQLLPALELFGQSNRLRLALEEAGGGYEARALLAILLPRWRGEEAPYVGVAPLLLAGLAVWRGDARVRFWAALAAIALVLSLGARTALFPALYFFGPGFTLFRSQERSIIVYALALAVLSGSGLAALLRLEPGERARTLGVLLRVAGAGFALALAAALLALLALAATPGPNETLERLTEGLFWLALLLALLAGWLALVRRPPAGGAALLALVALVALDLFTVSWSANFAPRSPDPQPGLRPLAEQVRALAGDDELFRVRAASEAVLPSNYAPLLGLATISGNTPIQQQRMETLVASGAEWRLWQLLNVRYELTPPKPPPPGLEEVARVGNVQVLRNQYPLPRAWAVRQAAVADDPADALRRVLAPDFHPGDLVVLEEPPTVGPLAPGPRPEVRIERYEPQRVVLQTAGEGAALLVLADAYYPGWRAFRDGVEVPIYRANYVARALDLPPGEHRIELVYDPLSFKLGAALSVLTLVAAALALGAPPLLRRARVARR